MILKTNILKVPDHEIDFEEEGIYKIPGELPTDLYFRLLERNQAGAEVDGFREGINIMYEVFKIRQPDLKREKYDKMMTINIFTAIINLIFADMSAEETLERLVAELN